MNLDWPLMNDCITREDKDSLIDFLKGDPIFTQNKNVRKFEEEWSKWVGVKYSVFLNSGSSANLLTLTALKYLYGDGGEIIVPARTWVSDIASTIQCGFTPVFVDVNPDTLGMDEAQVIAALTDETRAVFLTHILGFNGLTDSLIETLNEREVPLIEDVCESHGATHNGRRLGSFGLVSNFSFYFAHHLSTVEGGMLCTNDDDIYQAARMLRSHGMVRESTSEAVRERYEKENPELNPKFIFAYPAYNMRSSEINAVLGLSQLKRLDAKNLKRNSNYKLFLDNLDSRKYKTDFKLEGSSNYAFVLVINEPDPEFCEKVMATLDEAGVEYRRGTSGGGNQLRQPYLKGIVPDNAYKEVPNVEHLHFYGFYIGNYPELEQEKIEKLCKILNDVEK